MVLSLWRRGAGSGRGRVARALRWLHYAITLVIGVPLVGWTLTGFAFTLFDFEAVHGTRDRAPAEPLAGPLPVSVDAAIARARARRGADARVLQVRARMLRGRPAYLVEIAPPAGPVLVDAATGEARDGVDADDARAIAAAAFVGGARDVRVDALTGRGDALDVSEPSFRVTLDDARHTEVYVAAATGEIVGWQNDDWRRFDRLWNLHVFGFVTRDSPAQWPLRVAGGLALVASTSGAALLWVARRRRRRTAAPSRVLHEIAAP